LVVGFRHGDFDFILRIRRAGDPGFDELNRFGLGHSTAAAMMRCRHDPRVNARASGGTRRQIAQVVWKFASHGLLASSGFDCFDILQPIPQQAAAESHRL
jgi:hypothetical protein